MQDFCVVVLRRTGLVIGLVLIVAMALPAHASPEMGGRWNSNSLRDNGIGYYLTLSPNAGVDSDYSGILRFQYRDGRKGPRMPFIANAAGDRLTMRATSGTFDRGSGALRALISKDGSTVTLVNCRQRLRLVMANALDSDCVFERADID